MTNDDSVAPHKYSWDLNSDDLVIEGTIAAGSSGQIMAGNYNGLKVAIKVWPMARVPETVVLSLCRITHYFVPLGPPSRRKLGSFA